MCKVILFVGGYKKKILVLTSCKKNYYILLVFIYAKLSIWLQKSKIGENVRLSKSYAICCTFIF